MKKGELLSKMDFSLQHDYEDLWYIYMQCPANTNHKYMRKVMKRLNAVLEEFRDKRMNKKLEKRNKEYEKV